MMKTALALFVASSLLWAENTITINKLKLTPIIKLSSYADKALYDNGSKENIDFFYGRVTCGAKAVIDNFETHVELRAYPSGFGYELLRGVEEVDSTILTSSQKIAKFQVNVAYAMHHGKIFDLQIGRLNSLFNSNCSFYGNYVDEGPGGYFTGKGVSGNVVHLNSSYKQGNTSLMIGTNDTHINTGYLRLFQDFTITEGLHFGLGFRSNFLDKVHVGSTDVFWNATAVADYKFANDLKLYFEAGFTNMSKDTDTEIPIAFGVDIPLKKVLDNVTLEMEYLKEDQRPTLGDVQQSPVLLGLQLAKSFNKHFKILAGLHTMREMDELGLGLYMNAKL